MPFDEPDALLDRQDEHQEAVRRRYKEARAAGLSIVEAKLFAESNADVGQLRKLVAGECPPRLIFEILF